MGKTILSSPHSFDADPFRERVRHPFKRQFSILGQVFRFESNSPRMLDLADEAYRRLPAHRLRPVRTPIALRLHLTDTVRSNVAPFPPDMQMHGGRGLLCGAMDARNYALLNPSARTGLVVASGELLKHPYEARYELIEFAVFTLASRSQPLIPLHAACIGQGGRGLLLMGTSGAGKSTLAMLCASRGMDFLTEDATFVAPKSMLATGVANYLHLRKDSLRFVDDPRIASVIRRSPMIRRHSGVEKYELDLRTSGLKLAKAPLKIDGVVFVTRSRRRGSLLAPLRSSQAIRHMAAGQAYAAAQPDWNLFVRRVRQLRAYELGRGRHPLEAVSALGEMLRLS
jgi:hypothetical protein